VEVEEVLITQLPQQLVKVVDLVVVEQIGEFLVELHLQTLIQVDLVILVVLQVMDLMMVKMVVVAAAPVDLVEMELIMEELDLVV